MSNHLRLIKGGETPPQNPEASAETQAHDKGLKSVAERDISHFTPFSEILERRVDTTELMAVDGKQSTRVAIRKPSYDQGSDAEVYPFPTQRRAPQTGESSESADVDLLSRLLIQRIADDELKGNLAKAIDATVAQGLSRIIRALRWDEQPDDKINRGGNWRV